MSFSLTSRARLSAEQQALPVVKRSGLYVKRVSVRSSIVRAAPTSACRMARVGLDIDNHTVVCIDRIVGGTREGRIDR
jgi:hypothetical protein